MRQQNTKFFIFTLTIGFAFITFLLFLAPNVIAQTQDQQKQEAQKQLTLFMDIFEFVQKNYVDEELTDSKILIQGALKGMMEALDDPYSVYLTENDMEAMQETTAGEFGGVGLYILEADYGIEVARPIEGTPAFRAGITTGDVIIAVDDISTVEMPIDDVIDLLKGTPGTSVKMTILRGKSKTLDFTVKRAMIEIPTVRKAMIHDDMGYLRINQFTPSTYNRIKEAVSFFEENDYTSMIIDLRSNPGGLLSSVVDIADLFFPPDTMIVSTVSRIKSENREYKARQKAVIPEKIKIAVIIDKYSASASEILTGVLKDHKRATIIGETSYGKGSVQQIRYAGSGGIKLTMAKYYTPSGETIHKVGIAPDKEIKEEELTEDERNDLNTLYESEKIAVFVEKNSNLSADKIETFINSLRQEDIALDERYIKRLIRNEINRTNPEPPVYDLEYDIVLQEAVKVLGKK